MKYENKQYKLYLIYKYSIILNLTYIIILCIYYNSWYTVVCFSSPGQELRLDVAHYV